MTCSVCGSENVVERHCKIICLNCGYTRDCSDPFMGWSGESKPNLEP